jgi:ComF family protein
MHLHSLAADSVGVLSSLLGRACRPFLDVLFPPLCLGCGRFCPVGQFQLCEGCQNGLLYTSSADAAYKETLARLRDGGLFDELFVPFYFQKEGPLQTLIHELKYGGMRWIGEQLGSEIGRCLVQAGKCGGIDRIIPVPLHRTRLRERGYNQSACICRGIAKVTGIAGADQILVRQRNTPTQTTLTAADRVRNVGGAFALRSRSVSIIRDRAILLVDDVITTGATMRACAMVLRLHGARRVFAASAALAAGNSGLDGSAIP